MNKHMMLYLVLVLLAVLGLGGVAIAGGVGQERVDIQVETLEGDAEQARNLRLTLPFHADDHTLWETTFSPAGDPAPTTGFTYSILSMPPEKDAVATFNGGRISARITASLEELQTEALLPDQLMTLARELAKDLEPGHSAGMEFQAEDYTTYFDFDLSYLVPKGDTYYLYLPPQNALKGYFHIPIPDGTRVSMSITRTEDGDFFQVLVQPVGAGYGFNKNGCVTDGWIYLVLSPADFPAGTDFSQIRGGYGLYRIPTATDGYELDVGAMQTVLPLSYEEIEDICVMKSPWDGVLLLLTLEHGNLRLRLFDEASCTVLEDYTLDSYSSMPQVVQGENVLLLLSYDVPERSFLALVREDGQYVPSLRGTLPNKSYRWYEPAVAYRNGHLAFATLFPDEERPGLSMEVWIWEDGGEVFYGRFLRAAAWENSIYTSTPLRLSWKEDVG